MIELDLLRVRVAEVAGLAFLIEAREVGTLGEVVGVSAFQVLERLLEGMLWRLFEPRCIRTVAPLGEQLAQPGIAKLLFATLIALVLQRQRLVEHEPAHPPRCGAYRAAVRRSALVRI